MILIITFFFLREPILKTSFISNRIFFFCFCKTSIFQQFMTVKCRKGSIINWYDAFELKQVVCWFSFLEENSLSGDGNSGVFVSKGIKVVIPFLDKSMCFRLFNRKKKYRTGSCISYVVTVLKCKRYYVERIRVPFKSFILSYTVSIANFMF